MSDWVATWRAAPTLRTPSMRPLIRRIYKPLNASLPVKSSEEDGVLPASAGHSLPFCGPGGNISRLMLGGEI
jgi:hypothetical protein